MVDRHVCFGDLITVSLHIEGKIKTMADTCVKENHRISRRQNQICLNFRYPIVTF